MDHSAVSLGRKEGGGSYPKGVCDAIIRLFEDSEFSEKSLREEILDGEQT